MKAFLVLGLFLSSTAFAATKTYQVTGPIVDMTDSTITIEKKKGETWVLAKPAGAKVTGELKKGDKATVWYSMTAEEIEVKAAKK